MSTTAPQRLPVTHPGGQYNVFIGVDLLSRLSTLAKIRGSLAVITDDNVGPLYADEIADAACVITLPPGEQHKTLAMIQRIYDELLAAGIDRQGTVVALGGGVVGDMAGFAAATYMRGIDFVQCPTTLLAMVDASVGGKTGVDLPQGKNLVGAFKQPTAVLADVSTLQTLPPAELAAGMAEVIKHGLINDPGLFERTAGGAWLLTDEHTHAPHNEQPPTTLSDFAALIYDAVQVKRDVVQADPYERGQRALLNLGHTFGHALEQVSGYAIRHGEGVAMGLVCAANLSAQLGYCDPTLQDRIETALQAVGLPIRIPDHFSPDAIYRAMFSDKKKAAGKLRFILLRDVGAAFVQTDVPQTAVLDTLTTLQAVSEQVFADRVASEPVQG